MRPYYDESGITIYHGDCREVLADGCMRIGADPEVLVSDPPYGIAHASGREGQWRGQEIAGDSSTALRDWLLGWWGDRPAAVFGSWRIPRPGATRAVLIWDKGPASGMGDLSLPWKPSFEEVYILGSGWQGHRDEGVLKGWTVLTWSGRGQRQHPNEKPVGLLRYLLGKAPAGTILDPCMGSGTTLRAAKDLGRRAIGIELEERWCEVAARRLGQEVLAL